MSMSSPSSLDNNWLEWHSSTYVLMNGNQSDCHTHALICTHTWMLIYFRLPFWTTTGMYQNCLLSLLILATDCSPSLRLKLNRVHPDCCSCMEAALVPKSRITGCYFMHQQIYVRRSPEYNTGWNNKSSENDQLYWWILPESIFSCKRHACTISFFYRFILLAVV